MHINRVAYKIFFGFLTISIMILVIMSMFVKTSYARSLRRNEINFHMQTSSRAREQFDFIMDIIDNTARIIGSTPEIVSALTADQKPPGQEGDFSKNNYLMGFRSIQPFLGNITIV